MNSVSLIIKKTEENSKPEWDTKMTAVLLVVNLMLLLLQKTVT